MDTNPIALRSPLQMPDLYALAERELMELGRKPGAWQSLEELRVNANQWIESLREHRSEIAKRSSLWAKTLVWIDQSLRTDRTEIIDRPDYPSGKKIEAVKSMEQMGRLLYSYRRFYWLIEPTLRELYARTNKPPRILELACGRGELTFTCSRMAKRSGIPVSITGSDVSEGLIRLNRKKAQREDPSVQFTVLDALSGSLLQEAFDIVFMVQAVHHFPPGDIAVMLANVKRYCRHKFIAIDGYRSFTPLWFCPMIAMLKGPYAFVHDAVISTRKFYSEYELLTLARYALPEKSVSVRTVHPGFSVLTVDFDAV